MSAPPRSDAYRPTVESAITRVRDRFLVGYRAQHLELMALYDAFRAGTGQAATVTRAVQILHRISGTAGTLGLARLSDAARGAEHDLNTLPPDATHDLPVQIALYDFLLISADYASHGAIAHAGEARP